MPPKKSSWLAPLVVFSLVSFMYVVYLFMHLLPQLQRLNFLQAKVGGLPARLPNDPHMHPAGAREVVGLAIAFHIFFALFIASFFQAMSTPPGSVPAGNKWERGLFDIDPADDREVERILHDTSVDLSAPAVRELIRRMPIVERKKGKAPRHDDAESPLTADLDDMKRKCHGCMVYKPDRVHHCSVCGSCVLRMDHHCPWINNCVGFRNYKYFLLVLIYAVLSMWVLIASMLPRFLNVFAPVLDVKYFLRRDLFIALTFCAAALLALVLTTFLGFHIWLTAHAMSTIEYKEKRNHASKDVKHQWAVSHIKYDRGGWIANFRHVMGEPYTWPFPTDPNPYDDGTYSTGSVDEPRAKAV